MALNFKLNKFSLGDLTQNTNQIRQAPTIVLPVFLLEHIEKMQRQAPKREGFIIAQKGNFQNHLFYLISYLDTVTYAGRINPIRKQAFINLARKYQDQKFMTYRTIQRGASMQEDLEALSKKPQGHICLLFNSDAIYTFSNQGIDLTIISKNKEAYRETFFMWKQIYKDEMKKVRSL